LFQTFILDFSPDVAILHTGINDMWVALTFPDFRSDYSHCRRSFGPLKPHRWEYSPLLTKLLAKITTVGNPYRPNRDLTIVHLAHVPWLSEEVSLDPPTLKHRQRQVTDTVERNVRSFVAIARGNNVVPVLSTEPWGPTSDPRGKTAEVVAERIRATAVSQQVVLVDIAREMPWNPRVYYDACHLRPVPDGLERMGKIMANSLISAGVIEQARRHSGM
ncbi:SGNH/GDSL hydrolase family protein, partial [Candidatus Sumerlaeota bacterium]|nr:SGNH/GDSL hydrolase family protein [Candidatus Sumerlaeota bacterium]